MAANLPDGKPASLVCSKVIIVDTEFQIRHGTALPLRDVRWLVTAQAVGDPLLGRPILEALVLDTRNIPEKYSGSVDIADPLSTKENPTGLIARILDGVFHADGGAEDADLDEDDGWLNLGSEDNAEKRKVLDRKVEEARKNGMTEKGCEALKALLIEFEDVVKLKLDAGPPGNIELLRVNLKPDATSIRAKQHRYPEPKKRFMTKYVQQLLNLGFVKTTTAPEWVSARLIVPKRPPAMYRLTVDYHPVNSATVQTFWPIPNIEAELADTRGAKVFAAIDFYSGY